MAKNDIQSVLQEDREFPAPAAFLRRATRNATDFQALYEKAADDYIGFWAELARSKIEWHRPFTIPLDDADAPNYRWFTDGQLNVSHNCLDMNLPAHSDRLAIVFEGEPGDSRKLTYGQLHTEVCRFANALKAQGVAKGDRVIIYMPLVPEAVIAMQACARIGAVHSVVFGGFSSNAVKDRIEDAGAKLVITADGGWRGGHKVELKRAVDKALSDGCETIQKVVVYRRTGGECDMRHGRDVWWHDAVEQQTDACEPEWVDAEHPLFLLYTSGSTGKPKGIQHSSAGYLLNAKVTTEWVFDLKSDDVFWCTADVGWVTGHTYVCYGPLAAGATVLMYEGAPTYPDGGRFWKICETHGVTILYTAPTAIRALMKLGDEIPGRYDLGKLRLLGTVGEPINPEAWMWYHKVIGRERCPIVDTWWQTETGATMMTPLPSVTPSKPGSCARPLPGIFVDIVDEEGRSVKKPDGGGYLVIKRPWPSILRTIWGDNQRYIATYWEKFGNRYYVAGDSARRDKDGYYWIMGRIDDVLNVAGHRLGTMEIESSLVAHPQVAEAAVVGRPHDVKGESVFAYVVLRGSRPEGAEAARLIDELRAWVGQDLSPIARPDDIRLTDNLPKTRSGKIMRRLLRAIARGEEITQDVTTLENPAILEQLRGTATGDDTRAPASSEDGRSSAAKARHAGAPAGGTAERKDSRKPRAGLAKKEISGRRTRAAKAKGSGRRDAGTDRPGRRVSSAAAAKGSAKRTGAGAMSKSAARSARAAPGSKRAMAPARGAARSSRASPATKSKRPTHRAGMAARTRRVGKPARAPSTRAARKARSKK